MKYSEREVGGVAVKHAAIYFDTEAELQQHIELLQYVIANKPGLREFKYLSEVPSYIFAVAQLRELGITI